MTCLCLTRNRRQWLPKAIDCYRNQTYRNRELLIIADGDDVRDLVPNRPYVRLIQLDRACEIGEKRNFGCEHSGEVIAHWDDDDFSAPERLADQLRRLQESGKAVTGYRSMRFTDGVRWWLFSSRRLYAVGTSLVYKRSWWAAHRFPCVQVGEDLEFVNVAARADQLSTADAGDLMFASIHKGNTSPRRLTGSNWSLAS